MGPLWIYWGYLNKVNVRKPISEVGSNIIDISSSKSSKWVQYYEQKFSTKAKIQKVDIFADQNLHAISGWNDISLSIWKDYVHSCVEGLGISGNGEGKSLFDVGCGCLAFMEQIRSIHPELTFGGMDSSTSFMNWIDFEKTYQKSNFYQGLLPQGLRVDGIFKYDYVVCNSVFQYLGQKEAAKTVSRMLNLVKPSGKILICDICDEAFKDEEDAFLAKNVPGYGISLNNHTYFSKDWWKQFDVNIYIFHSGVSTYIRSKTRYQVVLSK
mmetsp:Transcript_280/g.246  ORF Transcript_280/g.246 Transcript_280/m.246 type:complete len:268 (+) Transcript_280:3-806(+)